ncbi:MAG: hypothetical protein ACLTW6_10145 [Enterobacter sp.]
MHYERQVGLIDAITIPPAVKNLSMTLEQAKAFVTEVLEAVDDER